MSSDLNKRIADLTEQLLEARETKYRLEDELNSFTEDSDIISGWRQEILKYEESHAATSEKIVELTEAKESLLKRLDEAKDAADNIESLNEQIAAADDNAETKQGALDEVLMSLHLLEAKLSDLEQLYQVIGQEHWLAQTNNEYVGGLQKKIDELSSDMEAVTTDIDEATERKYTCEAGLFQAMKARQQLGMKFNEAVGMANEIITIESKLMELDEVLAEEHDKLVSHEGYINQLQEAINQQTPVNESQNAELEACNSRIAELATQLAEARTQLDGLKEREGLVSEGMWLLLGAIDDTCSYEELYKLEESFNMVGMTIQKTTNDRMILCRCHDNKIVTENVIDDFIFVGPAKRLHEGVINKIKSFVLANEGKACTPAHEPVIIMNEDKKFSLDFLVESERSL